MSAPLPILLLPPGSSQPMPAPIAVPAPIAHAYLFFLGIPRTSAGPGSPANDCATPKISKNINSRHLALIIPPYPFTSSAVFDSAARCSSFMCRNMAGQCEVVWGFRRGKRTVERQPCRALLLSTAAGQELSGTDLQNSERRSLTCDCQPEIGYCLFCRMAALKSRVLKPSCTAASAQSTRQKKICVVICGPP
jgi:hypothetical protein